MSGRIEGDVQVAITVVVDKSGSGIQRRLEAFWGPTAAEAVRFARKRSSNFITCRAVKSWHERTISMCASSTSRREAFPFDQPVANVLVDGAGSVGHGCCVDAGCPSETTRSEDRSDFRLTHDDDSITERIFDLGRAKSRRVSKNRRDDRDQFPTDGWLIK